MAADFGYSLTNWYSQNTLDVGDLNNDGIPDVVMIGYNSRGFAVALGNANGILNAPLIYDTGSGGDIKPQAVAIVDLDQDGIPDIVVASKNITTGTSDVSWFKGNGDGTFQNAVAIFINNGIGTGCTDPRAIAAVDLDGDSRPEIAVLCYGSQALWIARRHTDGSWVRQTNSTINTAGGSNGSAMRFGHLTSAAGVDVVLGGLDTTNSLRIINALVCPPRMPPVTSR